jgi:hypothetical protein
MSKKKEMENKIQNLEGYKNLWEKTAHNLMLLINNEPNLVCPRCRSKLFYSIGYCDGDIMALCSFAHRSCHVFYYTVTNIHSQYELDRRYESFVNVPNPFVQCYIPTPSYSVE